MYREKWVWQRRLRKKVVLTRSGCARDGLLRDIDTLSLRELRGQDHVAMERLRHSDRQWLATWEATPPPGKGSGLSLEEYTSRADAEGRAGEALYFGMLADRQLAGQVSLSEIRLGAAYSAVIGYWVCSRFAGRGLTPLAVAMLIDWAFEELGLHRVEINIRPENKPSLRVVEKLGLTYEGYRRGLLHISGSWADHQSFAILREDLEGQSLVERLLPEGDGQNRE